MELRKVMEETIVTQRDWGMGIAGYRLKSLAGLMEEIAAGYRRTVGTMAAGPAGEVSESEERSREDAVWARLLGQCRSLLAGQYACLSQLFLEAAAGYGDANPQSKELRDCLKAQLSEERIRLRQVIFIPVGENRKEIHMVARVTQGPERLSDELAYRLTQLMGTTYVPARNSARVVRREYDYFVFRQTEKYRLLTGAVRASKTAGEPSGDNYAVINPELGECALVLSDGMGTGRRAYHDSNAVIELMGLFLKAGLREQAMVSLINSILLLGTNAQSYSTLDLSLVNLFDGNVCFAKAGAAATYVKHEDWVEQIENTSLPLGMLPEIKPCISHKRLYHGEWILMLSDGVSEHVSSGFLKSLPDGRPTDVAGGILLEALKQNQYNPRDDMTVLVAKLERI